MPSENVLSYQSFPFLSPLMKDYHDKSEELSQFIKGFPSLKGVLEYSDSKKFSIEKRRILNSVFLDQYDGLDKSELVLKNIELLNTETAFTITTGHQLCLFTGPLYFIYKIASVINLCNQCNTKHSTNTFIPVFWMATEDHDFEEINHFYTNKSKKEWSTLEQGGVGRMDPKSILDLTDALKEEFGLSINAQYLYDLFVKSYSLSTLSKATQFLANELFGSYGLLVLDADDKRLKKLAIPCFKKEIEDQLVYQTYTKMEKSWPGKYKKQVNARLCNLFYLEDNFRGRLIKKENGLWEIDGLDKEIKESDLLIELKENPERFSPNVIMRPMYQELILPNLAYIGGGGELAYWFLFKRIFEEFNIDFPFLILRKSAINVDEKFFDKMKKSPLNWEDLLLSDMEYFSKFANQNYQKEIDLEELERITLAKFQSLADKNPHLKYSFEHRAKEITKSLEKTNKSLKRSWKKDQNHMQETFYYLKNKVYPKGKFQERFLNFFDSYMISGQCFIDDLVKDCNVFKEGVLLNNPQKK